MCVSRLVLAAVLLCSPTLGRGGRLAWAEEPSPGGTERAEASSEGERPLPRSTAAALAQAAAAYEYGDMPLLVESARWVTDGSLPATPAERAQALEYLGIGLYVTGRIEGARDAFSQLLALAPEAELDPATTRPEIVAAFYEVRRARVNELRATYMAQRPSPAWNFLPPFGQFNNGDRAKGWILLGAEAVTFVAATVSFAVVTAWKQGDGSVCERPGPCGRTDTANTLRDINLGSSLAFAALYVYGVLDGLLGHRHIPGDDELLRKAPPPVSLSLLPNGAALSLRF